MSLQAYQKSVSRAEDPRSTEYRLLGQATQALIEARGHGPFDISRLAEALDWNRRIWNTFASDCGTPGNAMPDALRAGIVSLAIFVTKHSSSVLREGAEIEPLIDINKTVMQGLEQSIASRPATAA